jgi:hypothetical protein
LIKTGPEKKGHYVQSRDWHLPLRLVLYEVQADDLT